MAFTVTPTGYDLTFNVWNGPQLTKFKLGATCKHKDAISIRRLHSRYLKKSSRKPNCDCQVMVTVWYRRGNWEPGALNQLISHSIEVIRMTQPEIKKPVASSRQSNVLADWATSPRSPARWRPRVIFNRRRGQLINKNNNLHEVNTHS